MTIDFRFQGFELSLQLLVDLTLRFKDILTEILLNSIIALVNLNAHQIAGCLYFFLKVLLLALQ